MRIGGRKVSKRILLLSLAVAALVLLNTPYWLPQSGIRLPPGLYVSATNPPTGILHEVALQLTNGFSTAIAGGAQVAVNVNWTEWNQYSANKWAANNLQNVMFYDSEGSGTGVPLNAYLEACGNTTALTAASCSYGNENSRVWLKLNATGIPPTTSITVYLGFFVTTTDNFLSTANGCTDCWGEAAILTQSNSASLTQSTYTSSGSASSLSKTTTSAVTSGDSIVVATSESVASVSGPSSVTDNQSNTYTERTVNCPATPSDVCTSVWTATASSTGHLAVTTTFAITGLVYMFIYDVPGITTSGFIVASGSHISAIGQYYPIADPSIYLNGFTVAATATYGAGALTFTSATGWNLPTGLSAGQQMSESYVGFGTPVSDSSQSTVSFGCSADCGANGPDWALSAVTFLPSTDHYGNEDNGPDVFNSYYNFNGTSLSSAYSLLSLGSGMYNGIADGFQVSSGGGSTSNGLNLYMKTTQTAEVVEMMANSFQSDSYVSFPEDFAIGYSTSTPATIGDFLGFTNGYVAYSQALAGTIKPAVISSGSISYAAGDTCVSANPDCAWYPLTSAGFGWPSTSKQYSYVSEYVLDAQAADGTFSGTPSYFGMGFDQSPSYQILYEFQVIRTRAWIPGNGQVDLVVLGEVITESQAQAYGTGGTNLGQEIADSLGLQSNQQSYGTGGTSNGQQLSDSLGSQSNGQSYGSGGANNGQQLSNSLGAQSNTQAYGTGGTNNGQQISESVGEIGTAWFANTQPIKISNTTDIPGSPVRLVQSKFISASAVTTITDTFSSSTTSGNTIAVLLSFFYGATVSISDSQGNSFTSKVLQSQVCGSLTLEDQIWTATLSGSTADAVTITFSTSDYPTVSIYEMLGVSNPVTSTGYNCASTSTSVTSFTVGSSGIVLAEWSTGSPETATAGAGYTIMSAGSQYGNGEYSSSLSGSTTASATLGASIDVAEAAITFSGGVQYPSFAISGGSTCPNTISPNAIPGDATVHNVTTNGGCQMTITAPSGYRFTPSLHGTATLTVCSAMVTCSEYDFTYQAGAPVTTLTLFNSQKLSIQYLSNSIQTASSATVLSVDASSVFTLLGPNFNGQFTMSKNGSAIYEVPSQFGNGIQVFSSITLSLFNYTNAQPNPYLNMTGTGATIQVLDPSASTGMAYLSTTVAGNPYTPTISQSMIQVQTSGSQNVLMYFQRPGGCPSCGGQTTVVTQTFTSSTTSTVVGGVPLIDNVQINVPPNSAYTKLVQLVIDNTGVSLNSQLTAVTFSVMSNVLLNYNYSELPVNVPPGETGTMPVLFQTGSLKPGTYVIQGSATIAQQTGSYNVGFKITIVVSAHPVVGGFGLIVSWLLAWWWMIVISVILVVLGIGLYMRQNG